MTPEETKLTNCYIVGRDGDDGPLFFSSIEHGIQCRLDRYAIIPLEEYNALRSESPVPVGAVRKE